MFLFQAIYSLSFRVVEQLASEDSGGSQSPTTGEMSAYKIKVSLERVTRVWTLILLSQIEQNKRSKYISSRQK